MSGGRPRKPIEAHILEGTFRKDRHGERSSGARQVQGKPPRCPSWLDKEAKAEWKRLTRRLAAMNLPTALDHCTLACLCAAWSEFHAATKLLQAEGRVIRTGGQKDEKTGNWQGGQLQPHPAVAMQRSAWKAVKQFSALFGLDPSSHSRLHVQPPPAEVDEFEEFLRHHGGSG
jgi:P27 family predicted phage terminase small subunit